MTITKFLNDRGFHTFEGYSQEVQRQVDDLVKLTQGSHMDIMEIGFNAGHSADVFLKHNPGSKLTSFDLGGHEYVLTSKEYIDAMYPNRHTLILGDSTVTIPIYTANNPDKKFDVIFIDGGHDYTVANADLENCMKLAHKDTIVIIDDTIYKKEWVHPYTVGPTQAWVEHIKNSKIKEIHRVDYKEGRGMSWGKYIL